MKALILAAGYGTRLHPLTRDLPKALLDVGGRTVLDRLVDQVKVIPGLDEIVLVTNDRFLEQFNSWAAEFGGPTPVRVISDGSTTNETRLGAIADIHLVLGNEECTDDDWLIVAGDNLVAYDLAPHFERFRSIEKPLLMVRRIEGEVPAKRYSEVTTDEEGMILTFREKPETPVSDLSATCCYFFPPQLRDWCQQYLEEGGNPDAPGYFLEWLHSRVSLAAARISGTWFDIGDVESLETARAAFWDEEKLK